MSLRSIDLSTSVGWLSHSDYYPLFLELQAFWSFSGSNLANSDDFVFIEGVLISARHFKVFFAFSQESLGLARASCCNHFLFFASLWATSCLCRYLLSSVFLNPSSWSLSSISAFRGYLPFDALLVSADAFDFRMCSVTFFIFFSDLDRAAPGFE